MTGVFVCLDPSFGEPLWSATLHASSGNLNVTCSVNNEACRLFLCH